MSSMTTLPYGFLLLLVIACILSLVFFSACVIMRLEDEDGGRKYLRCLPQLLGPAAAMPELALLRTAFLKMKCGGLVEECRNLPWIIHVIFICLLLVTAVWSVAREGNYRRTHFVRSSIKEAVDTMPAGLCFADLQGRQVLVNHRMAEFVEQQTGHLLQNVLDFLQEIKENHIIETCSRLELFENPEEDIYIFRMQDGQVMQLTGDTVTVAKEKYIQLVVTDITMQHDLYENLSRTNEALIAQRREMRLLAERLIQSNHEEELLDYKIRVHNDVGQMILTTGQILDTGDNVEAFRGCASGWIGLAERFANTDSEKNRDQSELLEEIVTVAEHIGCKVVFTAPLPEIITGNSLVRQAIREAIVNAVRHGGADEVTVHYGEQSGLAELTISNNGTLPPKGFSMKGGLKNLYESIRGDGGSLRAEIGERFALILTLPYAGREV